MTATQSAERSLVEIRNLLGPMGRVPSSAIYALLRDSGDSFEMAVDADPTPVAFEWVNPIEAGRNAYLERMLIGVLGAANEDINGFFSLAALGTGLLIDVRDKDGTIVQTFETADAPIKRHAEWSLLAGVDVAGTSVSMGNESRFGVRWTFSKATNRPFLMAPGWSFRVTVRDDISALTMLRMAVQGYYA